MALDFTIHRCDRSTCNRVARWTRRDDEDKWWCKDHAPGSCVYVKPDALPPEPEREGTLIGHVTLKMRNKV